MAAKRYKCPYCEKRLERKDLILHVGDDHEDVIPKGYTPARVVYNSLNKREHGTCMICKKETKWDESKQRYDTLCGSKRCHDEYVKMVRSRMIHKYGSYNLLNDPEFQKKMLAGRKISGTYKFQDGGKVGYVGSYEKKFLEFMDKFLNIKSYDIISPGPTIPYKYKGKEHTWITDFLYEPYNLVFDIKDGGDNPNTRDMKEYREKQTAKENAIAEYGDYNYIRLTDNKFEQLILIMMELKEHEENTKPIIKINESFIQENFFKKKKRIEPSISEKQAIDKCITSIKNALKNNRFDDKFRKSIKVKYEKSDDEIDIAHYDVYDYSKNIRSDDSLYYNWDKQCKDLLNTVNSEINKFGYFIDLDGDWDSGIIYLDYPAIIKEETRIDDDKIPELIYHVSTVNHNGEIFEPRYYDNDNVKKDMERRVKRVCFADSINGAIYSIFPNGTYDIDLYIHVPGNKVKVYSTTSDDIYDSDITHELWVKEPVEMKCIGKIHISGTSNKYKTLDVDKEKSGYGKRKYYEPRWSWVEKYNKEEPVNESIKSYTAIGGLMSMINPKNWGNNPVHNGDFDKIHDRLLKYVKKCKTKEDIDYLRQDLSLGKSSLNKLKKNLQYALDNPDNKSQKCEEMRKRNKKGLTVEKIDNHIKWVDEVYRPALNNRAKEIRESIKESSIGSNIDTVIFDIGNVLVISDFEGSIRSNPNIPDQFADELIKSWLSVDENFSENCTSEEYINEVKKSLDPRLYTYLPEVFKCSINCIKPIDMAFELICSLKKKGIKVYYLSNWCRWSFEEMLKHDHCLTSLLAETCGGIVSYQVGFKKPDKKIYQILIDRYNLDPLKCIFYDNKEENVNTARSVGFNAEIFNYKNCLNQVNI